MEKIVCPKCGTTELDELGIETSGAEHYGCPKCRVWFTVYGEPYDAEETCNVSEVSKD